MPKQTNPYGEPSNCYCCEKGKDKKNCKLFKSESRWKPLEMCMRMHTRCTYFEDVRDHGIERSM